MYLFIDTETTGIPNNWKAPVTDIDNWPRMVQIAWLLYDSNSNLIEGKNYIIRPDGYNIPSDATTIHKITTELALATGNDLTRVLREFSTIVDKAEYIIAHNLSFDEKIVGAELLRKNIDHKLFQKKRICTMEETTNYCAIAGNYGYKWPKLSELYFKLFNIYFEETHNAASDIQATAKCFWELRNRGFFNATTSIGYYPPEQIKQTKVEQIKNKNLDATLKESITEKEIQYAKFEDRFFAWLIDFIILFIVSSVFLFLIKYPMPKDAMGPFNVNNYFVFLVKNPIGNIMGWLYYSIMESSSNQGTFGKMAIGLKVTDGNGNKINFGKATGRFWSRFICLFTFGFGYLMILFTNKKQGLHDKIANCLILKKQNGA